MHRKSLLLLAIASLVLIAFGCRKEKDQVLATVGNQIVTVGEWEIQYSPTRLGTPDEMMEEKMKVLDAIIDEKLQLNEAEERGYGENEELKAMMEDRKRMVVVNELYKVEVMDKVKVPVSQIREAYDKIRYELDVKRIMVATEEEAKSIRASLLSGADFDMLAQAKSLDGATKDKGGSLGWIRWGSGRIPVELADTAYKLKEGEISVPVKDRSGWHILKLAGKREAENVKPFEDEKERIENTLKHTKLKETADAYLTDLKERIGFTYNEDVVKLVAKKSSGGQQITPWAPAPLPKVSESEKEMVIVRSKAGDWTVGKLLEFGAKMPPQRPIDTPEGLRQWVEMLYIQDRLVEEALKKGLDRMPTAKADLQRAYEVKMVNLLRRDEVDAKAEPTDQEIKAEYEADKSKYAVPEENWVHIIVTPTEDQADQVLKALKRGTDFEELAKEKSIHPSKQRGGNMGVVYENRDPDILKAARALKVGRLSEPTQIRDGWAIIKVTKREKEKARSFEEARKLVQRDLRQRRVGELGEALIARLKEKYPVAIDEKLLERVGKEKEGRLREREEKKDAS